MREGVDRVVEVRYDEETGTSVVRQHDGGGAEVLELSEDADLLELGAEG